MALAGVVGERSSTRSRFAPTTRRWTSIGHEVPAIRCGGAPRCAPNTTNVARRVGRSSRRHDLRDSPVQEVCGVGGVGPRQEATILPLRMT